MAEQELRPQENDPSKKKTNERYIHYLDSILGTYSKIENHHDDKHFEASLQSFRHSMSNTERKAAMDKLIQDSYLKESNNGYEITMSGFMFINEGGYHQRGLDIQNERDQVQLQELKALRMTRATYILTLILALSASVASIYYLIEIVRTLGHFH